MIIKVMFVFRIICVVCRKDADCWRSSQEQHTLRMMKSSAKSFWWPITTCSSLGPFVKEDALQQKFVQRGLVVFMLLQGKLQHQATYVCMYIVLTQQADHPFSCTTTVMYSEMR